MNYEFRQYIGKSNSYKLLENVSIPFSFKPKLNEEKDEALITIVATEQKRRIAKNTRIEIVELDSGTKLQFVVVKDTVTRVSMGTPFLYNHDILLIESTALLENVILPSLTFSRNTGEFLTISNATEFINISQNLNANYTLLNDITIPNTISLGDFSGTLNGNGHTVTIQNLELNNDIKSFGLFSNNTGTINNVNFVFENCEFTLTNSNNIEHNRDNGFGLLCSVNNGTISQTKITNSNIKIKVNGGIFSTTSNVLFTVGTFAGTNNGTISKCWTRNTLNRFENGSVAQKCYIGNVVGLNNGIIENVASWGGIIQSTQTGFGYKIMQGGFAGHNKGTILNSYCFSPSISCQSIIKVAGFTPKLNASNNVTNCYFWVATDPSSEYLITDSLGTYKTQAQMQNQATYIGFDFNTIWEMDSFLVTPVFKPFSNIAVVNPLSIENVLNRILDVARPIFIGQRKEFELSTNLLVKLSELNYNETSEFYFNELNLWEALLEIGGKINAIPYLEDYKYINYLFLNANIKDWTPPANSECGLTEYQDPQECVTNLISFGKNVVVSEDQALGVLEFPYRGGFITSRTVPSQNVRITYDTSIFWIGLPIYDIESVKVTNVNTSNPSQIYDITRWIYEKNQYDALPSTSDGQGMALIFNQYGEYIYGLTEQPIAGFTPPFPALTNILVNGLGISSPTSNFETIGWNIRFRTNFDNIQNTIKRNLQDFPFEADLLINQTVNQVSSTNWGEYKNYKMDKMGNIAEVRRYILPNIVDLPEVGDKLTGEDLYVNEITAEMHKNIIVATIAFTKNFQKISEYISVNSRKRPFQIALDNIQDRHLRYEEFVRFSSFPYIVKNKPDFTSHITDTFMKNIFYPLGLPKIGNMKDVHLVRIQTFDSSQNEIADMLLPVNSYAQPRSVVFSTQMQDNISAGYYADTETLISSNGYVNRAVLYGKYGSFDSIKFNYLFDYIKQGDVGYTRSIGEKLPLNPKITFDYDLNSVFNQSDFLKIKKDNREKIYLTSQIHFINEEDDIIIGNKLSYNNLAVKDALPYEEPKLYILNRKLESYEFAVPKDAIEVDLNFITQVDVLDNNGQFAGVNLKIHSWDEYNCTSWFLADGSGSILLGKHGNLDFENNIYAFKQLTRTGGQETPLSLTLEIDTNIDVLTSFTATIYGENSEDTYNLIDYGDGTSEYFKFNSSGYFDIDHEYIPNGIVNLNIYTFKLTRIFAFPQPYIIKGLFVYDKNLESIDLQNNSFFDGVQLTDLLLYNVESINEINLREVSTLNSIVLEENNKMQFIDLSYSGLVNEEDKLLDIVSKLPTYTSPQSGTFVCVGTDTPVDHYSYWQSVLDALEAKGWNYIWLE
jgi:hypothetical protein